MSETVTRSVTIVWRPARFPMRWAESPEDVPTFDPSRGGDPFYEGIDFDLGEGEQIRVLPEDLGGGASPPQPMWHTDADLAPDAIAVSISGPNYPRLVRASYPERFSGKPLHSPLEEIAALTPEAGDEEFMGQAKAAAEAFGPLSFSEADASLEGWRLRSRQLAAHLRLLAQLQAAEEYWVRGKGAASAHELDREDRDLFRREIESMPPELAIPMPSELEMLIAGSADLGEFRVRLAEIYWEAFGHQLRPYGHGGGFADKSSVTAALQRPLVDVGSPGQLVVRCGALGWSLYELWRSASEVHEIRVCPACSRLFHPTRRDKKTCSHACRTRLYRTRKELAE